ncbi:hypothetical protein LBMAG26_03950 [Bacteroidota bacterium]|jgi:hypothetical protein|nr:hypothetical protein LBMAG26_03950 [Bacteroidota bacterium]
MSVIVITEEALEYRLEKLVVDITNSIGKNDNIESRWIRSKQVKELLGISDSKLQTMRVNRSLTFSQIDGTYFYDRDSIMQILEQNKVLCEQCRQ